jgi:hypothetical protein
MKRSLGKKAIGSLLGCLLVAFSVMSFSTPSSAQIGIGIGISVHIGPPALPVYAQPVCPGPGYLWTPGYWAWNDDGGYYWVPGTWVVAPVGLLWTPGYWGFVGGVYGWHAGYWGPHVGFYGGINYGFGYGGVGFAGGEWRGGAFFYNRSVMNVNVVNIHNVYEKTVIVNNVHTSFNGPGGIVARPTVEEERYAHEQHTEALASQREQEHAASLNRASFASENHGRPEIAATGRPGEFSGHDVVRAREAGAAYHAPAMSPRDARVNANERANDRAAERTENREAARNENAARNAERNDARNNVARNNEARNNEARNADRNEARNNVARNNASRNESRNNESHGNNAARGRENAKPAKPAPQHNAKPEKNEPKKER